MRPQKTIIILILLVISLKPAFALQTPEAQQTLVEAFRASGVTHHLAELELTLKNGFKQREKEGLKLLHIEQAQLEQLLDNHYNSANLEGKLIHHFSGNGKQVDPNRLSTLSLVINSVFAQNIQQRVESAHSEAQFSALQTYARELENKQEKPERQELITQLDHATARSELFTGIQALSMTALMGIIDAANNEKTSDANELQQKRQRLLRHYYSQLLNASRYTVQTTFAFATQDLSDDELRYAVRVYNNSAYQWFMQRTIDALIESLFEVQAEIEKEIAQL